MKTKLFATLFFAIVGISAFAQEYEKPKSNSGDTVGTKGASFQSTPNGIIKPSEVIEKGTINPAEHNEEKNSKKEERLQKKNLLKKMKKKCGHSESDSILQKSKSDIQLVPPTILSNWYAGQMTMFSPPDHAMAIANNGNIIVADNERIYFYTSTGSLQGSYTYNSFFSINQAYTDPHVLYDSGSDRFIFVIQCGPNNVEKIIVAYSVSNNPFVDGFYSYSYDIAGLTGSTIDYPNIAVSTDELFVTGNLGSLSNILLQFDKLQGYSGGTVNGNYWTGINDGGGVNARALFPLTWGQQGNYGPGIYVIATEAAPSIIKDKVYLYEVTNNQYNSPSVSLLSSISVPTFTLPTYAVQLGTNCQLDASPWDNVTGGFYLNGIIHFCYMVDDGTDYSQINYNRIDVSTYGITTQITGLANSDYRFASVASIGTNISDQSVVVGFLRSDNSVYPQIRYKYYDNAMTPTASALVKLGDNYACSGGSSPDRWGDYTTMQRRFNTSTYPTVWLVGGYGNTSNSWSSWVAEIGYSNITNVNSITENNFINIFPNPTSGTFTIQTNFDKPENAVIRIYNTLGETVREINQKQLINNKIDVKLEKASGVYFVEMKTEAGSIAKKIILQ